MNDTFSFKRLPMVWRCYSPGMSKELLLIGALTLVTYIVSFMATQVSWGILIYGMVSYITLMAYCCGPLHFARFRDPAFELQIPATPGERTAVMLGYTLVAVPAVMAAVWFGASLIVSIFTPDAWVTPRVVTRFMSALEPGELKAINSMLKYTWLQNIQNVIPALVCLLCVVLSRRNKVLKGIIGIIVTYLTMSVAVGIFTFIKVVIDIKINGMTDEEFFGSFHNILALALYSLVAAAIATVIFTAWRLNRAFRHRQA
jgi:membrane protein